jgi:hypothetical protein
MKSPDIFQVTLKVLEVFEKLNIPYYIGGSLASSAFGVPRATLDVDLVADIRPEDATVISQLLDDEFFIDVDMILKAIQDRSSFNIIHLETMFKIDIFILKERAFDQMAFSRRVQKSLSEESSRKFIFATPEDIMLNKLEWYQAGGNVSDRQWNDIIGVLKVQGRQLDFAYLRRWANKLGISSLLKRAIDEAEEVLGD